MSRCSSGKSRIKAGEQAMTHTLIFVAMTMTLGIFALAADKPATVVMLGDSATLSSANKAGSKLTECVQANLNDTLHVAAVIVNSGKGSDTAKGGYERVEKDVIAHNPDVVTISFGLNDTGLLTPDEYREWLDKLVRPIQERTHAKILLVTSTPFNNARHAWGAKFASKGGLDEYMDANICAATRKIAEQYHLPLCDLHALFVEKFKKDPALMDKLIMPDGVHLTNEGNKAAAEHLAPAIAAVLSPPKTDKGK